MGNVTAGQAAYGRRFPGLRAIFALMLREMSTTYGRSPGGYLWAILEPAAGTAVMTIAFSLILRQPALGTSFAMFYATGLLPFMAYQQITMKLGQSIRYSRPLLAYPNVVFIDAIFARFILNALTNLLVFVIVIGGIVIAWDLPFFFDLPKFLNMLGMLYALILGIGTVNCYLMSRFPIWAQIWSIINRPLFIASGVIFVIDEVPDPYREWLYLNPVAHVLSQSRMAFFSYYDSPLVSPLYVYTMSAILCFFGFLLLYRHHAFILDEGA